MKKLPRGVGRVQYAANRADPPEKEEEGDRAQQYLPTQPSAEQLTAEVAKAITEAGAEACEGPGRVMKTGAPPKGQAEARRRHEAKAQLSKLG